VLGYWRASRFHVDFVWWVISLDSVHWSAFPIDFLTGSGVNISLSTRIAHESPRITVSPVSDTVGRCKSKESTETVSKGIRVIIARGWGHDLRLNIAILWIVGLRILGRYRIGLWIDGLNRIALRINLTHG